MVRAILTQEQKESLKKKCSVGKTIQFGASLNCEGIYYIHEQYFQRIDIKYFLKRKRKTWDTGKSPSMMHQITENRVGRSELAPWTTLRTGVV